MHLTLEASRQMSIDLCAENNHETHEAYNYTGKIQVCDCGHKKAAKRMEELL